MVIGEQARIEGVQTVPINPQLPLPPCLQRILLIPISSGLPHPTHQMPPTVLRQPKQLRKPFLAVHQCRFIRPYMKVECARRRVIGGFEGCMEARTFPLMVHVLQRGKILVEEGMNRELSGKPFSLAVACCEEGKSSPLGRAARLHSDESEERREMRRGRRLLSQTDQDIGSKGGEACGHDTSFAVHRRVVLPSDLLSCSELQVLGAMHTLVLI